MATKKTLLVEGTIKQYDLDGRQGDYLELVAVVNGIPVKLYAKNGDSTGKLILLNYFKQE